MVLLESQKIKLIFKNVTVFLLCFFLLMSTWRKLLFVTKHQTLTHAVTIRPLSLHRQFTKTDISFVALKGLNRIFGVSLRTNIRRGSRGWATTDIRGAYRTQLECTWAGAAVLCAECSSVARWEHLAEGTLVVSNVALPSLIFHSVNVAYTGSSLMHERSLNCLFFNMLNDTSSTTYKIYLYKWWTCI